MTTIKDVMQDAEKRMDKVITVMSQDFASMRLGRANPAILDKITVDYYGAVTPLNQVAGISVPDPSTLVIQPWDKSTMSLIEKAILASDLGLTPNNDGSVIRINIPRMTEERRKEAAKSLHKRSEEARVAVRNIRRDANDKIKAIEKKKEAPEDDCKWGIEEMQRSTEKFIKKIDESLAKKEKEVMEF